MSNDKFFNALLENPTPPDDGGSGISLDDLQAFEKRITETITARIDERIKSATQTPTQTPTPTTTPTQTPTPTPTQNTNGENGETTTIESEE